MHNSAKHKYNRFQLIVSDNFIITSAIIDRLNNRLIALEIDRLTLTLFRRHSVVFNNCRKQILRMQMIWTFILLNNCGENIGLKLYANKVTHNCGGIQLYRITVGNKYYYVCKSYGHLFY